MQRVAGAIIGTQDDMKKQLQLDHDKVMKQLQSDHVKVMQQLQSDHDKVMKELQLVIWQGYRVDDKFENHNYCMHLWLVLVVGINLGMYILMVSMVENGRYTSCYVPKQNVTNATDDVYRETAKGYYEYTMEIFMDVLAYWVNTYIMFE